ncbi:MAG: triphosphoribosyl-dephospho-CoA synthase [Halobacteriales archaeon]|nr:triphosphoribosyl-dephospho-CoA synthase [Halobacteriales archaeon]
MVDANARGRRTDGFCSKPDSEARQRRTQARLRRHDLPPVPRRPAVGARRGFEAIENGADGGDGEGGEDGDVGEIFLRAVRGASAHDGGNTQFGALLLRAPRLGFRARRCQGRAEVARGNDAGGRSEVLRGFRLHQVASATSTTTYYYDVRDPGARERVVEDGCPRPGHGGRRVARRRSRASGPSGFPRTFHAASKLETARGDTREAVRSVYVDLLREEPDSLVAERRGDEKAREVTRMARDLRPTNSTHVSPTKELTPARPPISSPARASSLSGEAGQMRNILDARITETVATTHNEDGEPNAAPMGVLKEKEDDGALTRARREGSTDALKMYGRGAAQTSSLTSTRDPGRRRRSPALGARHRTCRRPTGRPARGRGRVGALRRRTRRGRGPAKR